MAAEARRTEAYRAVFRGSPSREDQEIVLADLQARASWNQVFHPSTPDAELRQAEGRRELYAYIYNHLSLAPNDVEALNNAARRESATINNHQDTFL